VGPGIMTYFGAGAEAQPLTATASAAPSETIVSFVMRW